MIGLPSQTRVKGVGRHNNKDYVYQLFRLIEAIAENQEPLEITKDLVEIVIQTLKRKKLQMKKNGQMK